MASTTKPTILFVHGSWHTPAHFAPVRAVFEKAGYPTSCQLFPSVEASPPIGLKEDAQCVKDELSRLIEAGRKDVIVVAHSYGGVVSTEACEKQFNLQERRKKGEKGGIVRIVYLCAFLIPVGKTLEQALGGTMPPWIPEDADGMMFPLDPGYHLYTDVSPSEQQRWIKKLRKCPGNTQRDPLTQAGYLEHPVTYLFCEGDAALPLEVQKMMVEGVKAMGGKVEEESCEASHSPFLSMPERVLEVVEKAAKTA